MVVISKENTIVYATVVDIIYCGVLVKATNSENGEYYFSIELFPQNAKQNTKPVDDSTSVDAIPDRSNVKMSEAIAYWISGVEKNADGTRKGGTFASSNFSLKGIPIGAELKVEILKNTAINTEVMVSYGDTAPFKAYACSMPSSQYAVDTYILSFYKGEIWIRVIKRASEGPDYTDAWCTIGGFLNGCMTVAQGHAAEQKEEGGIIIGNNTIKVFELGERNTPGREPRYMPFSYMNSADELITFGCVRGSTANAVVHLVISNNQDTLAHLAEATDKAEVVKGIWMPLSKFLALSNNPTDEEYVAWMDHQAGARAAAALLVAKDLIPQSVL